MRGALLWWFQDMLDGSSILIFHALLILTWLVLKLYVWREDRGKRCSWDFYSGENFRGGYDCFELANANILFRKRIYYKITRFAFCEIQIFINLHSIVHCKNINTLYQTTSRYIYSSDSYDLINKTVKKYKWCDVIKTFFKCTYFKFSPIIIIWLYSEHNPKAAVIFALKNIN